MATAGAPAPDKRRVILDAAVKVFARRGFTQCRVSDIADEAGVAYGLLYHYFRSKDEVLDTLFLERWGVMVDLIGQVDRQDAPAREKLRSVASFIIDSYRHDPDLMKVIIVAGGQASGEFRAHVTPAFAAMAFYGAIEQVLTGWIFETLPVGDPEMEQAKDLVVDTIVVGLRGSTSG
jgi:AcrR family transcriptional regulator